MAQLPSEVWKEVFMQISESSIPFLPGTAARTLKFTHRRNQTRHLKNGLKSLFMACKAWKMLLESYTCFWSVIIHIGWPSRQSQAIAPTDLERQLGDLANCEIIALMDSNIVRRDTWHLGTWRKELHLLVGLRSHHIVILTVPFAASDHQLIGQLSSIAFPRLRLLRALLPCPAGDDDHCAALIEGKENLLSNMRRNTGLVSGTHFSSILRMSIDVTDSNGPFGAMFQLLAMLPTIKDLCIYSPFVVEREPSHSLEQIISNLPPFLPNIQRLWMKGSTGAMWPIYLVRLLEGRTLELLACEFKGRSGGELTLPTPFLPIPSVSASKVQWTGSDSPLSFNLSIGSSMSGWLYPSNIRVTNPELVSLPTVSRMDIGFSPTHSAAKGSVDLSRIVYVANLSTLTLRLFHEVSDLRSMFGFTSKQPTVLPALTQLTAIFRVPPRIFDLRSFRTPSLTSFTLKYDSELKPESSLTPQMREDLVREGGGTIEIYNRHAKDLQRPAIAWESYLTTSKMPFNQLVELAIPDGHHLHIVFGAIPNVAILRIYILNYATHRPYCFQEISGNRIWREDPFPLSKLTRLDIIQECLPRIWNYECWDRTTVALTLREFISSRRGNQCLLQTIVMTRGFLQGQDRELLHGSGVDFVEIEEGNPDLAVDLIHFDRSSDANVWD
jgi:hypothetical protein